MIKDPTAKNAWVLSYPPKHPVGNYIENTEANLIVEVDYLQGLDTSPREYEPTAGETEVLQPPLRIIITVISSELIKNLELYVSENGAARQQHN